MTIRLPSPSRKAPLILVPVALWCVGVLGVYGYEWVTLRMDQNGTVVGDGPADRFVKFAMPGIVRPSTAEARDSRLRDDEEVIGFEVGRWARAYRLDALRDRSSHLVNDVIGEVPVSVTYCDLSDCVRAFTGPAEGRPLDVGVGGLSRGRDMVLEVGGTLYFQETGARFGPGSGPSTLPLERLTPTRTTWGAWKRLHPSTDVYEGTH